MQDLPTLDSWGYVATTPTFGPLLIWSPALKRWGPPRWLRLRRHQARIWALLIWIDAGGYGANPPVIGPLLILFPGLKHWEAPKW